MNELIKDQIMANQAFTLFNVDFLDLVPAPVFFMESNGRYFECNAYFKNFFMVKKSEVDGDILWDELPGALEKICHYAQQLFLANNCVSSHISTLELQGNFYNAHFYKCNIRRGQEMGEITGYICALRKQIVCKNIKSEGIKPLTTKEKIVLSYAAEGLTVKEMAKKLMMSHHTVACHFKSIHSKLEVKNRTLAVMAARHLGLI